MVMHGGEIAVKEGGSEVSLNYIDQYARSCLQKQNF